MRVLSKFAAHSLKLIAPSALALGLTATSVSALTINDTFLSTFQPSTSAATFQAVIQSASNQIASLFSNPITVNILFATSSAVLGQSQTTAYLSTYAGYTNLLQTNATANPANTILSTAVANLSHGNGADGSRPIISASADLRALGVSAASGAYNSSGNLVNSGGTYDGIITLSPTLMGLSTQGATAVIQHEIDEILGGGGVGSTLGTSNASTSLGGLDLYRYQVITPFLSGVTSTPSFTTSSSAISAFSVDGGATGITFFNQFGSGSDYGDFTSTPCLIQSAFFCAPSETFTTASPEYQMLEALGYDPVSTTPLPSTWLMLLSGFVGLGFFAFRGTKKNAAALAAA